MTVSLRNFFVHFLFNQHKSSQLCFQKYEKKTAKLIKLCRPDFKFFHYTT